MGTSHRRDGQSGRMILQRDKYLHNLLARYFMSELNDDYDFVFDDPFLIEQKCRAERREKMISCLTEVAAEATAALNDAGLFMPLFFSVPSSGGALAMFGTPADPSEADWHRACDLVTGLVGGKLGMEGLWANALPCVASGIEMDAADIIPGSDDHPPEPEPNR